MGGDAVVIVNDQPFEKQFSTIQNQLVMEYNGRKVKAIVIKYKS